ncbi:MAG: alkaline phosphatase family protein [Nitrolancea sp.]
MILVTRALHCAAFLVGLFVAASPLIAAASAQSSTPIKHLIVVMQSAHSFDNYFGTYPGANGIPDGTCMPVDPTDPNNMRCVAPFHIGSNDVQPGSLNNTAATAQLDEHGGAMDGFVYALNQRNQDGRLAMGYYDGSDIPYYWNIADQYVLFDNFFSSAIGGSESNHQYWVAGATSTGDASNTGDVNGLTTIFDRLSQADVSWKFYVQNYDSNLNYRTASQYASNRAAQVDSVPLLSMDRFIEDPELASHIVDLSQYYVDLANDTLPAVAYVVASGPSEHPPTNIQSGERFVRSLLQSLMTSDSWISSAFMLTYDDWGGWFDHVSPPQVDANGLGFRVPALLVSPYAKQGFIDHTQLDFTSILKFIEQNYGLQPLATRDASANDLSSAFDFRQAPRAANLISMQRDTVAPKVAPKRQVIYAAYGTAVLLAGLSFCSVVLMRHRKVRLPEADS